MRLARGASFILSGLMLLTSGCAPAGPSRGGAALAPTAIGVLFQDSFSDPSSGWDRRRDREMIADYDSGGYRIVVTAENSGAWGTSGRKFADAIIEVEATKVGGPDDNNFGILCRYRDESNYYQLTISSDGHYAIGKVVDGDVALIGADKVQPSDAIQRGKATNRLRVVCAGDTLSLTVNGELLTTAEDDTFDSGDIGLIAGTYAKTGTDILFDNLVVKKP